MCRREPSGGTVVFKRILGLLVMLVFDKILVEAWAQRVERIYLCMVARRLHVLHTALVGLRLRVDDEIGRVLVGEDLVGELRYISRLGELRDQLSIELWGAAVLDKLLPFSVVYHHEHVLVTQHGELHSLLNDCVLSLLHVGCLIANLILVHTPRLSK